MLHEWAMDEETIEKIVLMAAEKISGQQQILNCIHGACACCHSCTHVIQCCREPPWLRGLSRHQSFAFTNCME